jgi:hypothetical protein
MKRSEITKRPERIVLVLIDINRYHASNVAEKKKKKKEGSLPTLEGFKDAIIHHHTAGCF